MWTKSYSNQLLTRLYSGWSHYSYRLDRFTDCTCTSPCDAGSIVQRIACGPTVLICLSVMSEQASASWYNWMLLHGFQNRLHQHRLYTWVPLVLAHYLHNVYMTPSQVTVYMLIAQQGVSRDYTTVLHFTDPNMSPFLLIPDLLHLHWLHHGLHRGHNWLQCIAYSLHWRCAICHMIACIYSMKDPASALTALIIACASIKEVIVAQFFQDLVFSFAFQNSVGQIAYWTSFALPA